MSQHPSLLCDMVEYIANKVTDFQFPDLTAHALRRATKRMAAVPRPAAIIFDTAIRDMLVAAPEADADAAFVQFAGEACAHHPWLRNEFLLCAARHGCTPACRALVEDAAFPGKLRASQLCMKAAGGGHQDTLEWARSAGFPWHDAFFAAAEGGHADLVRWMHEQPLLDKDHKHGDWVFREDTFNGAAAGGHLPLLEWADSLGWGSMLGHGYHAASRGQTHVLQWMVDARHGSMLSLDRITEAAAYNGHVATLEWLVRRGATLSMDCVQNAAANGHLPVLQFMRDQGVDLRCAYLPAIHYRHPAIVRWLHDAGFGGDGFEATACAARTAHAETLRLLHSDLGVPACRIQCSRAAGKSGGVAVLRYLHANGLLDAEECLRASLGSQRAVVAKWLATETELESEMEMESESGDDSDPLAVAMTRAAVCGDLPTVQWLHARGVRIIDGAWRVHPAVRNCLLLAN